MDLTGVEEFLNTLDERTFTRHGTTHTASDALTSVPALATWLRAHGLPATDHDLDARALATARDLRDALRSAAGGGDVAGSLTAFPLALAPDPAGGLRITATTGVRGLDAVVEAVATSVATGKWGRLKLCASPDCRWAFHDTSRSGGGRWCSMETCGNRHKTRNYRQRRTD